MAERDIKTLFAQQIDSYRTMALATSSASGIVDCATVYFAHDKDGIYFATDRFTVKAANLSANRKVAAALNDGGVHATGIQIRGTAEELTNPMAVVRAKMMLTNRIDGIGSFLSNPNVKYYRFKIEESFLINFAWGVDWRSKVSG